MMALKAKPYVQIVHFVSVYRVRESYCFLFENEIQGERGEKGDAGPIGLPVNYQILI
jgi:hypothetical protein